MCRCLFLADNHVTDFPDVSLMPHLHTLELARNHLKTLGPARISSATLCCLHLSSNQLTTLSQLQRLPCLRELAVSDNQLTSLEGLQVRSQCRRTNPDKTKPLPCSNSVPEMWVFLLF